MRQLAIDIHRLRALLVLLLAAAMAAGLLVLVGTKPAEAAFPGQNGKIVYWDTGFAGNVFNTEIYAIDPNAPGPPANLTNDAASGNPANDFAPAFSADGRKIAYVRARNSGNNGYAIYVMNADGSKKTLLTEGLSVPFGYSPDSIKPSFSPDGKRIAFASADDGDFDIYVMNSDGSGTPTKLTNNADIDVEPAFSPDGSKIAYASYDSNYVQDDYGLDILVMDTDPSTNDTTNLTNAQNGDSSPAWSSDGTEIVFSGYRNLEFDILVMDTDPATSDETNLTETDSSGQYGTDRFEPAFSPEGDKIVFTRIERGGDWDLYTMEANGSGLTPLIPITQTEASADWGIKPGTTPPTVIPTSLTPADNATNVDRDTNIKAKFSVSMDKSTINTDTVYLTVTGCQAPCPHVPATVSYNAKKKRATLNPIDPLEANTQYTAVIEGANDGDPTVRRKVGTALADTFTWTFTTGSS